ncbi:MAG: beta-propeller domain-containing protein [Clostridia bacterium]|nr:beta-propeller domain-containing protein [Clostridia bacterium]
MKEEKMLRAFSLVDDDLVEKAAPREQKPKIPFWWKRLAYVAVAACLMLAVVLPIAFMGGDNDSVPVISKLDDTTQNADETAPMVSAGDTLPLPADTQFVTTQSAVDTAKPAPDVTKQPIDVGVGPLDAYKDSEYFSLIEMLDALLSESEIDLPPSQPTAPDIAPSGVTNDFSGSLTGADSIQRSDTHIFCLKDEKLEAYTVSGHDFVCVGAFDVGDMSEFSLLDGGKKVLLLRSSSIWTKLLLLDVSDPACMKELRRVRITGRLCSSKLTDAGLVLATNYTVWEAPEYDNPTSFVPYMQYDGGEANHLPMEDIILPTDKLLGLDYAVIYSLDPDTLTLQSRKAILGSGAAKITENYVFIHSWHSTTLANTLRRYTDLYCFDYQDGVLTYRGDLTLEGRVSSLDEKDGILRVVADVAYRNSYEHYSGVSFYCVSLQSVRVVAELKEFTENGQTVQSVYFDGDTVYIGTQHATSSPTSIYLVDFSNHANILCVTPDEPIARSISLAAFGDGAVLGIGYGNRDFVGGPYPHTIGIFKREGDKAVSVAKYRVENAAEATGHLPSSLDREYYLDPERQLVGFAVRTKNEDNSVKTEYILLHFDGKTLSEFACVEIGGDPCAVHTLLLDGKLHVFGDKEHRVISV